MTLTDLTVCMCQFCSVQWFDCDSTPHPQNLHLQLTIDRLQTLAGVRDSYALPYNPHAFVQFVDHTTQQVFCLQIDQHDQQCKPTFSVVAQHHLQH
jgi:hypothetical protein